MRNKKSNAGLQHYAPFYTRVSFQPNSTRFCETALLCHKTLWNAYVPTMINSFMTQACWNGSSVQLKILKPHVKRHS